MDSVERPDRQPVIENPYDELLGQATNNFDIVRHQTLQSYERYADSGSRRRETDYRAHQKIYNEAFQTLLDVILQDNSSETHPKLASIATILTGAQHNHGLFYADHESNTETMDDADVEDMQASFYEELCDEFEEHHDNDAIKEWALDKWSDILMTDDSVLVQLGYSSPRAKLRVFGKEAVRHGVDIAKVGAGVTLALLLDRKLNRQ